VTTKCLLVCENDILVAGVKAFLTDQIELEIYTINANIAAELTQTIETRRPNVVMMDDDIRPTLPNQIWQSLISLPNLQVIIFSLKDNLLHIHQDQWSEKARVQDLGKIIRNHQSHPG